MRMWASLWDQFWWGGLNKCVTRIVVFVTAAHVWACVCRMCTQLHFSDRLWSSVRLTAPHHQLIIFIFNISSIFSVISSSFSSLSIRALPEGCRPQALQPWTSIPRAQVLQSSAISGVTRIIGGILKKLKCRVTAPRVLDSTTST